MKYVQGMDHKGSFSNSTKKYKVVMFTAELESIIHILKFIKMKRVLLILFSKTGCEFINFPFNFIPGTIWLVNRQSASDKTARVKSAQNTQSKAPQS